MLLKVTVITLVGSVIQSLVAGLQLDFRYSEKPCNYGNYYPANSLNMIVAVNPRYNHELGANSYGQLSLGHKEDQLVPREAVLVKKYTPCFITGGGGHSLLQTSEKYILVCGSNSHGQLGSASSQNEVIFVEIPFPFHMKIVQVAGGWDFSLAVTVEGELFSWGNNIFCQLGRNSSHKGSTGPARVEFPDKVKVVGVAAGLRHGLAKTDDGAVYGWGDNKRQQVVNFDNKVVCSKVQSPMRLTLPLQSKVVQVVAGAYHSGALTETREVHLWGCKRFGQISAKAEGSSRSCLTSSDFGGETVKHLAVGWTHNIVLTESGNVYSWGRADYGQLGRPCDQPYDPTPKLIQCLQHVQAVVCGSEHTLAISGDGRLYSWGWNEHGMCGTGDTNNVFIPTVVELHAESIILIGCGAGHSFACVKR